jgi:LAS superfamily LD-carboxypeptidase LdcB
MAKNIINDYTERSIKIIESDAKDLIQAIESFTINFRKDSNTLRRKEDSIITKYTNLSSIRTSETAEAILQKTESFQTQPISNEAGGVIAAPKATNLMPQEEEPTRVPPIIPPIVPYFPSGGEQNPDGSNGRLKDNQLKAVGDGARLWTPAADAYLAMKEAAREDGVNFILTEGYRDFAGQVIMKQRYGKDAAEPGTSVHGWGRAIDISSPGAQEWIVKNGRRYGWIRPSWASFSYEPWHFEYIGGGGSTKVEPKRQSKKSIVEKISTNTNYQPIILANSGERAVPSGNTVSGKPSGMSLNNNIRNPLTNLYMHTTYGVG